MIKKLMQFRNMVIVLLTVEVVISLLVYMFFPSTIAFALMVYIFIKNILCSVAIYYIHQTIVESNYSVQDALHAEAKNALIFGGIGLIKYDENRNIEWVSDLLYELGLRVVGKKLLEWQPLLATLFEDDDVRTIDINSRRYEVYNSKATRLLYLKDVTDLTTIQKEYTDQQLCVAYLTIDNYDDSIEYADEQKSVMIETTSRQMIFDWAKDNGIILKRYKEDGYLAIFNERIYRKQVEVHFSILDEFKTKMEEIGAVMSLSIGIGRGSKVLRELDGLAFSAISLSYSRGGDQVAVKTLDEEIRYFGGNSENSEKANRVRARVISQTLASLIKQSENVLVMGHKQSDLDSFGASLAIKKFVDAFEKKAYVILDESSLEEKTGNIARKLMKEDMYKGSIIPPMKAMDLINEETLLICVDNHKPTLAISEEVIDKADKVVVIDHHRRGEDFMDSPILTYLEPAASSTVELIVELFEYQRVEIEVLPMEATVMYAGMLIDTNYFRTHVGSRTFQVASKLKEMQANVSKAYEILQDDYKTTLEKMNISANAYRFGNDALIAYGNEEDIHTRPLLAKVGNELLNISEIKAVFVVGRIDKDKIAISARSKTGINVQLIMEKLGGGGHFSMAACQVEEKSIKETINKLEEAIDQYLDERG